MPYFNPNLAAPAVAVSRFHDTFFNDPPPYVLSSPIEAFETYNFPSVPSRQLFEVGKMDSEHGDLQITPDAHPGTTNAPERFSPEEEEVQPSSSFLSRNNLN
jgi:hypothetical protein